MSPWYKSEKTRQGKTTPKYDPDKDQGRGKARGPKRRRKPDADTIKAFGTMTVEDRTRVYRYTVYGGSETVTYVLREKMTDDEYDEYVVQRWREANGRGPVTARARIVQAARGNKGMRVMFDELALYNPVTGKYEP